jgi:hypothetical protein
MPTGKNYKKEPSIQGAALFVLSLERDGMKKLGGAREIIRDTFKELGVTEDQVYQHIKENRAELEKLLADRAGPQKII